MALNSLRCNHLTPLRFKGLNTTYSSDLVNVLYLCEHVISTMLCCTNCVITLTHRRAGRFIVYMSSGPTVVWLSFTLLPHRVVVNMDSSFHAEMSSIQHVHWILSSGISYLIGNVVTSKGRPAWWPPPQADDVGSFMTWIIPWLLLLAHAEFWDGR